MMYMVAFGLRCLLPDEIAIVKEMILQDAHLFKISKAWFLPGYLVTKTVDVVWHFFIFIYFLIFFI